MSKKVYTYKPTPSPASKLTEKELVKTLTGRILEKITKNPDKAAKLLAMWLDRPSLRQKNSKKAA